MDERQPFQYAVIRVCEVPFSKPSGAIRFTQPLFSRSMKTGGRFEGLPRQRQSAPVRRPVGIFPSGVPTGASMHNAWKKRMRLDALRDRASVML